jgi:hypothetical protein
LLAHYFSPFVVVKEKRKKNLAQVFLTGGWCKEEKSGQDFESETAGWR